MIVKLFIFKRIVASSLLACLQTFSSQIFMLGHKLIYKHLAFQRCIEIGNLNTRMEDTRCLICIQLPFSYAFNSFIISYFNNIFPVWEVSCRLLMVCFSNLSSFSMLVIHFRQLNMVGYLEIFLMIYPANMSMGHFYVRWGKTI